MTNSSPLALTCHLCYSLQLPLTCTACVVYSHCGPRVSEAAADKLKNRYVLMRGGAREHENQSEKRLAIPITVR